MHTLVFCLCAAGYTKHEIDMFAHGLSEHILNTDYEAIRRGLRTYGMLCPLIPGLATAVRDVDELLDFCLSTGAEEKWLL